MKLLPASSSSISAAFSAFHLSPSCNCLSRFPFNWHAGKQSFTVRDFPPAHPPWRISTRTPSLLPSLPLWGMQFPPCQCTQSHENPSTLDFKPSNHFSFTPRRHIHHTHTTSLFFSHRQLSKVSHIWKFSIRVDFPPVKPPAFNWNLMSLDWMAGELWAMFFLGVLVFCYPICSWNYFNLSHSI